MIEQTAVFITLAGALIFFVIGKIRYDLVAMLALMVLTLVGIIPAEETFLGFANPAVVTVVAVLVLSRALENAGLVDIIGRWVAKAGTNATQQVALLTGLVTLLSAFINNVGALALLIPVAIQLARKSKRSPSFLLMPMAFGSLLGGMTTLIGTPPNLIISEFRRNTTGQAFSMFDFSPVGVGVALAGVLFIGLVLFSTALLSSVINNASAAIVMAPVAINIAQGIGAAIDPFLLAVAIGASCAFLTPIGHQSNTLVMGPGGYYFSDYWPLGICVELIVVVTAIPLLYYFWPLFP